MHNRNTPAVKRVEYCRLQTKNHDKDSTSCKLDKYILSFPRTWNA